MKLTIRLSLLLFILNMITFLTIKTFVLLKIIPISPLTHLLEYVSVICLVLFIYLLVKDFLKSQRDTAKFLSYYKKLNQILISQTHNPLFYQGNVNEGSKILTKEIVDTINTDRCSIWLYNQDKTSIICQQLYVKSNDSWYEKTELLKKDFREYFNWLDSNPIIVANNAETHSATSCFTESYLKPLGIKSMLDVPIVHKGKVIGVVCVESLIHREWLPVEVNFVQLLSSLYSFAYSVKESNKLSNELIELDRFVDSSVLVSRADSNGKITYVNKKFEIVSGWNLDEVINKDHKIVNSGEHPKSFWNNMYRTVIKEKSIWNSVVTNKTKQGELYWVDSYIKGDFDEDGNCVGFLSIRYDISDVIKKTKEIEKKNIYLEHASKIIRHDMHSGINTYIPRGINSLERRLTPEIIEKLKLESPLKMAKEGLAHTQKVYKGVYEFTNLVKKDAVLNKTLENIKLILDRFLITTSYKSNVIIEEIGQYEVNESLFCTAIDNLIRNGLKYNDSETKFVKVYFEKERKRFGLSKKYIVVQDNGRGMTQNDFNNLSKPYIRKEGQKETGSGLGLNICITILEEHGFEIFCEKNSTGTKIKIKIK